MYINRNNMEAILKFNLKDENDKEMYLNVSMASGLKSTVIDLKDYLRNKIKYQEMSEESLKNLEEVYDYLYETLHDYGVSLP